MDAHTNRSARLAGQENSGAANKRSKTGLRVGAHAEADARHQQAHSVEPITLRVPDACRYIGISRSTLYLLIAAGEIEIIKLGSSTLVLTESLKTLIASRRGLMTMSAVRSGA